MDNGVKIPKVSIIIPAYNCEKTISRAIDSCLDQTYDNYEIVVVDDGSRDNTYDYLLKKYDTDINNGKLILFHTGNKGPNHARNFAINNSTGEYYCLLDTDDYCSPDRLKKSISYLQNNDKEFVFCGYQNIYINNVESSCDEVHKVKGDDALYLIPACFSKNIYNKIGPFDEDIKYYDDFEWVARAQILGIDIKNYLDDIVYYRFIRNDSYSYSAINNDEEWKPKAWMKAIFNAKKYKQE